MSKASRVLMVGTALGGQGGIAGVLATYRNAGLYARWTVLHLATHGGHSPTGKILAFARSLAAFCWQVFVRRNVSVVHVHTASRWSFLRKSAFVLLARIAGVPAILHVHGAEFVQFLEDELPPPLRRIAAFVVGRASIVLVLNRTVSRCLSRLVPGADIRIHPNPVAPPAHAASDRPTAGPTRNVVFLGELGRRKGTFDLLDAFARLPRDPDTRLLLCGNGAIEEAREMAARLGIADRVVFGGWVSGDRKAEVLRDAALFTLPSYAEGLPVALLEAMGYALPIVATPVGGISDAVTDGVEGLLVPPGGVEALAKALARLLGDEALREAMGQAAFRKFHATYSTEVVIPQIEAVYRELGAVPVASDGAEVLSHEPARSAAPSRR